VPDFLKARRLSESHITLAYIKQCIGRSEAMELFETLHGLCEFSVDIQADGPMPNVVRLFKPLLAGVSVRGSSTSVCSEYDMTVATGGGGVVAHPSSSPPSYGSDQVDDAWSHVETIKHKGRVYFHVSNIEAGLDKYLSPCFAFAFWAYHCACMVKIPEALHSGRRPHIGLSWRLVPPTPQGLQRIDTEVTSDEKPASPDLSRISKFVLAVPNNLELWERELVKEAAWLAGVEREAIELVQESTAGVEVCVCRCVPLSKA
jgi:hypothetical protein